MEKRNKIIYWIATGLLSTLMLISIVMYTFKNGEVRETFALLGYPGYIVYPLALAKLLGLIAILTKKSALLKEWAYAGFFFNLLLAVSAHTMVGDGEGIPAEVGIILLLVSYIYDKKVFPAK
jgi:hypothetical protein